MSGCIMAENMFLSPTQVAPAQLGLNIIDIIDSSEKDFVENEMSEYIGGGTPSEANCSAASSVLSHSDPDIEQKKKAYVQIIEQPQPKALRFRYICEGRSAGSIPGVRSTAENKTYPTIKILNYKGPAVVVVSCVTKDPPYRPHPHNLVGKEGCSKGVCTITIDNDSMECMFSNLGIQCVKKKDVEQALKLREEIRVDPYATGFAHRNSPQSIDLNAVRLCFQVFLNSGKEGRFTFPLKPVVSDPIYDKKATSDLNICKLSDCTSCVSGGKEIILLCDKVTKEDIQIRFYEIKDGHIEWEAYGDFQASDVHKQVAISFKTPKYKDIQVEHSVKVFIQLQRPSDNSTSEPRPFEYLPMDADRVYGNNKRRKIYECGEAASSFIDQYLDNRRQVLSGLGTVDGQSSSVHGPRSMKVASRGTRLSDNVKIEPQDSFSLSPSPEPRMRTVSVKPPISPQHNVGGVMIQNISPLPPPHASLQLQSPLYYASPSPTGHGSMLDVPLHSPQAHYYQMSPGIAAAVDPSRSPNNPPGGATGASFNPNVLGVLPNTSGEPNMELLETSPYSNYNETKPPPVDSSGALPLPDLGVINSSDLNVDSIQNLSASLSCSLNLGDAPLSLNPLEKKCSEEEKRSLSTPTSDNFFANIPVSCNEHMRSEEAMPSSDSVKMLKGQLETLKKLSERS